MWTSDIIGWLDAAITGNIGYEAYKFSLAWRDNFSVSGFNLGAAVAFLMGY